MNKLLNYIGIDGYRCFLVAIVCIPSFFDVRIFHGVSIFFGFCLPGILNELLNKPDASGNRIFFVPGRFLFPYETFLFVWNGFRVKS